MAGVPGQANQTLIESKTQLVDYIESGNKPKEYWRVGTEHEKFGFRWADKQALPYDGPAGIRAVLNGMKRFGWEPVSEGDNVIALKQDGASITLEPGGQFELSGAPLESIWQTCDEVNTHLSQVQEVSRELGIGFIGLGMTPNMARDDMPMMPKGRYQIMRRYMPTVGTMGLDMMFRTCTVQANLDYSSEADMVKKFRVSLALQPVATALFANSPFMDGKPNGYLSYRSHIWEDTDPDRCGVLPFVFEDGMGFERYVDYVLDVPMYFIYRDGEYIDASGQSFRDYMKGTLPARPGQLPTLQDWADHTTTAFPEVRLKKYLEMRGADTGPWNRICALPAFWTGLLYDATALDAAWDLVKDFTVEELHALRNGVPRHAFKLPFRNGTVLDVARQALQISAHGLARRARRNEAGEDETMFLAPLMELVEAGETPAERKLALYHGEWGGNVDPVFREFAY